MKYALCVIAASLALAACSQGQPGSSWFGSNGAGYQQPGPGYPGPTRGVPIAGGAHSNFHAAQSLKERVIREVVQASQGGEDVSAAKRFEERGEEALRQGQITLAAEQFGRAEEALAARGPEGSVRERTEEMTEEEETTGRHRHHRHHRRHKEEASESTGRHKEEAAESSGKHKEKEEASESSESTESKEAKETSESSETSGSSASSGLTRDRVKTMADKVKDEISSAKDNGKDVSDAQRHKSAGDKALDDDQLHSAMNHYKLAEKALKNARAGESSSSESTTTKKNSSEESTTTSPSTGTSESEGKGAASPESGTSGAAPTNP